MTCGSRLNGSAGGMERMPCAPPVTGCAQADLKMTLARTWGGLVGISGNPRLIDGGSVTAPTFAYYDKDGTWGIEGHGVDPDIEVIDDPAKMVDGGDPQLDAAIEQLESDLAVDVVQRGAFERRG